MGHPNVAFTGLDIVSVAPDLETQGVNWKFVQHDLRRPAFPFEDESFELVVLKDMSLVVPLDLPSQRIMDEAIRVLKRGGTLEISDSDHVIRSILPHPPPPPSKRPEDQRRASETASFLISPTTPFATAQNKFIQDANSWIQDALDRRKLPPTPCSRVAQVLLQEPDALADVDYRRIAIPLGELRWERENPASPTSPTAPPSTGTKETRMQRAGSVKGKRPDIKLAAGDNAEGSVLTEEQAGLRYTALLTVVQMIESMEPFLKEVSGKSKEEWHLWWSGMMTDLLEHKGASSGECLELGAWWAKRFEVHESGMVVWMYSGVGGVLPVHIAFPFCSNGLMCMHRNEELRFNN